MATNEAPRDDALAMALARQLERQRRRNWLLAAAVTVSVIILAGAWLALRKADSSSVKFRSMAVQRGEITVTVKATGNLEPVNVVEVGAEVSGMVKNVTVDFNSRVKNGQVLATLDTEQVRTMIASAEAALALAEAGVQDAQVTAQQAQATRERTEKMAQENMSSQGDLDTARANDERAKAALTSARARVVQARAALANERTRLEKSTIRSPMDGIVLTRKVEPGQTLAAAFQIPVLFTLADDLSRMELHVQIDEADIGAIRVGQNATFTVSAYPNRTFDAIITQAHYAPTITQDVVTYEATLAVDNKDLALRPGMTATVDIVTQTLHDVLRVPNSALRFTPPGVAVNGQPARNSGMFSGPPPATIAPETKFSGRQRVWIMRDGAPAAVEIVTGATDGHMSEVKSGELAPGVSVLVDIEGARP